MAWVAPGVNAAGMQRAQPAAGSGSPEGIQDSKFMSDIWRERGVPVLLLRYVSVQTEV